MDDREYQKRLREGTLPVITCDNNFEIFKRIYVNSQKFPFCGYPGFRVLHNGTIFERKKSWWIFGKWIVKGNASTYVEICILDEGVIR